MTRQRSSGVKALILILFALSLAALTVRTALAAPAQQGSTDQAATKSSAAVSIRAMTPVNSLSFLPAVTYASGGIGNYCYSAAVADVNGDGTLDLVVANGNENMGNGSVGVLLGNGDGTFRPAVTYDSGATFADYVVVADVNGDGKPDIVVVNTGGGNNGDGSVGVLLGNGDGTFRPAVTYDSGGQGPDSVAVADVNLDGKPDLLVANGCFGNNCASGPWVGVLLGNGDGSFQPVVTYDNGGSIPMAVAAADVNGDGKPDMLVANPFSQPNSVGVRLGNGDGTFQSEVLYGTGGTDGATSVVAADVNMDGNLDLLVVNFGGGVGVLLGDGDGTFQPVTTYASGGSNNGGPGLAVADVNGDGKPDLLVANYAIPNFGGALDVLLGNGDGTFQPVVSFSSGGYGAQSVAVADLNGDGKPDVVVAMGPDTLGVLINNGASAQSPTITRLASSQNPSTYGQPITFTATVTTSGPVSPTGTVNFKWGPDGIGQGTLNASGVATFTTSILKPGPYKITAVYKGDASNLTSTSTVLHQGVER